MAKLTAVDFSGATMGTRYNVTVFLPAGKDAQSLQSLIDQRLELINRQMSTYDPESELSRFNDSDSTEWFEVSEETAGVVSFSLRLAEQTTGAFDPTIGPLVNLWGFGPDKSRTEPPTAEEIAEARESIGHQKVKARLDPPALRKLDAQVYLDLSAVAKGHGVDQVAELLEGEGVEAYMVEIGGEVRTRGRKPDGSPWRIGVESAGEGGEPLQQVIELLAASVATSGDYRNYFEHQGKRYSHTINPATGSPVTHTLATVTVLAPTCREADALATALLVMGPQAGYDWAVTYGVTALMVTRDENDRLIEKVTPDWADATSVAEAAP